VDQFVVRERRNGKSGFSKVADTLVPGPTHGLGAVLTFVKALVRMLGISVFDSIRGLG
jgi:hypothetical protein